MDAGRKRFEREDPVAWRHPPHATGALVHGDLVGIDIPRPQGDTGGVGGDAQVFGVPCRKCLGFSWH